MTHQYKFETLQVHGGVENSDKNRPTVFPIYQTSGYCYENSEQAANLFKLNKAGYIYNRLSNPTTDAFERRIAALENGKAAVAFASGQAAQFSAIFNICKSGDNIVSSPKLYGGTYNQFKVHFRNLGIGVSFANNLNPNSYIPLINKDTKAIYIETLGNPDFVLPDIEAFAKLAHKNNIPLIIDNTLGCGGFICRPIDFGADIVVASTTKWICGHGTTLGGVLIDAGNFDWDCGKFPSLSEPNDSYHGIRFTEKFGKSCELGNVAFAVKAKFDILRDFGATISPFNSFLLLQGLETLSLRVERESQNALELAKWLELIPEVEKVNYIGLENNPSHKLANKYFKNGFGAVMTFKLKKGKEAADKFVDNLKIVSHTANLGDVRTLIIHPSSTTHQQLSKAEQKSAGVEPGLLRLSVGIEHIDDLKNDFKQSIAKTM